MGPNELTGSGIKPFAGTGFGLFRLSVLNLGMKKGWSVHFEHDLETAISMKRVEIVETLMNPGNFCAILPTSGLELAAMIVKRKEYLKTEAGTKEFTTIFFKAKSTLEEQAVQALGTVQDLVAPVCKNVIEGATGAAEVLELLQDTFLPNDVKTRTQLEAHFNDLKFEGSCAAYKSALWEIACDRELIEDPVHSASILLKVLRGASQQATYANLAETLIIEFTKTNGGLTEEQIYALLYNKDKELKDAEKIQANLTAVGDPGQGGRGGGRGRGNGRGGGRGGGRGRGNGRGGGQSICFGCGEPGHFKRECPVGNRGGREESASMVSMQSQFEQFQAFQAFLSSQGGAGEANKEGNNYSLVDSAASRTMSDVKEYFESLVPLVPCVAVWLADGKTKLLATHVGTAVF